MKPYDKFKMEDIYNLFQVLMYNANLNRDNTELMDWVGNHGEYYIQHLVEQDYAIYNGKIIINDYLKYGLMCKKCGDRLFSFYTHDFCRCNCGQSFIDGGDEYQRAGGDVETIGFCEDYDIIGAK